MTTTTTRPVPANATDEALAYIANGGRLVVRTALTVMVLDRKVLRRFEKAGAWLLKAEGEGYRVRNGARSVYLLPGQLEFAIEA